MRIAIVGTGALGGWYAGLLAEAGHEVHCLARSDHEAINRDGLTLRNKGTQRVVRVASAAPEATAIGPCDLVVVTLKSTSNAALPRLLGPLLGPATLVVTLQNGMGNVEALAKLLPAQRIVAGLCFVCINRLAPAVIDTTLAGYVRMAAAEGTINPAVQKCVEVFAGAGVDCQAEASLEAVLWKKLCWNIPFNGLSIAGGGITTDLILADPALNERAYLLMKEVQAAAEARGHGFEDAHIKRQFVVTVGMGPYRPSSLIDFQEGRDVEVEGIWGEPLRRGLAAGVPMPQTQRLVDDIKARLAARK
ncbi:MAG: 2-dehydropantoate 2-reductase [Verrucomicrobia bacterium]|nr:2-dehydropantoate 2-reductase [Verrucomicrobiota bacterium]